ncbi:MAG: prepilin peptidase [Alphaproteobacteria bacterium]
MIALVPFLLALFFIDLRYKILPDQLNLIAFCIGVAFLTVKALLTSDYSALIPHAVGACVFPIVIWCTGALTSATLKKNALGFGDVKFFAVAGLWLGVSALVPFLLLSGVLGVMFGSLWQTVKKEKAFPFGPALIVAFFVLLLIDASKIL